jgi:hypothetical protein
MEVAIIVAVVAVVLIALIVAMLLAQRRRRQKLRGHFGPEYANAVESAENRRTAEKDLRNRQRERERLEIRPLAPGARERYAARWASTQESFVDTPADAVRSAQDLLTAVMEERGYPVDDFEARAAFISVDHPTLVENYRSAHQVSEANRQGTADTEDLRQALVHYRSLFDELLADGAARVDSSDDENRDRERQAEGRQNRQAIDEDERATTPGGTPGGYGASRA